MECRNLRVLRFRPSPNAKPKFSKTFNKVLHLCEGLEEVYFKYFSGDSMNRVRYTQLLVDYLLKQKRVLKRDNLRIYFCNILITKPFRKYKFRLSGGGCTDIDAMLMTHYHRLADRLPDHCEINRFSSLFFRDPTQELPECFFERFPNIQFINGVWPPFDSKLIAILGKCKNLSWLDIDTSCHITQSIIDRLPELCPQLRILKIDSRSEDNESVTERIDHNQIHDYQPICRLRHLYRLEVCPHLEDCLNLQIVLDLFKECRYLAYLMIRFQNYDHQRHDCSIHIKRETYKLYSVELKEESWNVVLEKKNIDFNELTDLVDVLQREIHLRKVNYQTH